MKIVQKEGYKLITTNNETFETFIESFEKKHPDLVKNNLIIKISDELSVNDKDIFIFLQYADKHQKNGTSFVVVCKSVINVDDFPETFNVVPTLQEGEDVLEMENIQRDLGF